MGFAHRYLWRYVALAMDNHNTEIEDAGGDPTDIPAWHRRLAPFTWHRPACNLDSPFRCPGIDWHAVCYRATPQADAIIDFAHAIGLEIALINHGDTYNGDDVINGTLLSVEELFHEIAHWILADPGRRREVNFGLGPQEVPYDRHPQRTVSQDFAAAEEARASLLGAILSRAFGFHYLETIEYHEWFSNGSCEAAAPIAARFVCEPHIQEEVDELIRRKLVVRSDDYTPRYVGPGADSLTELTNGN